MNGIGQWNLLSEQDYLADELVSPVKHEFVGGSVHVMAGFGNQYNGIAVNTFGGWHRLSRLGFYRGGLATGGSYCENCPHDNLWCRWHTGSPQAGQPVLACEWSTIFNL